MEQAPVHDVFVIGGGINGCGIARDAAGRGYSVYLAEMNDLASGTSSWSTKLVHGGLRYLEHYEFRLVREALMEREVLWRNAPHIIKPMRFVLPLARNGLRPDWLVRMGLFLYDHIGGRKLLPPTKVLDMRTDPAGKPLKPIFTKAFEYSDGWVDDARLVVLNARDAADRGALIRTRTKVVSARRRNGLWMLTLEDQRSRSVREVAARLLVNAAGPWVDRVLDQTVGHPAKNVRLVQGSHIVVPKKFDDPRAFFFQNSDGRIIFAIPFEDDFTLIGTTDHDYRGDPGLAHIGEDEITYLCAAASEYFSQPVRREDVVWTYSGVRPLYDDGASKAQEATRDYVLKLEAGEGEAAILNIFGGKITTYRRLAEAALDKIEAAIGRKGNAWTATAPLPGGDFPATGFSAEVDRLKSAYPFLARSEALRLTRLYGTKAREWLGVARAEADLGPVVAGLREAEIRHLIRTEWAMTAEDVLWRRTKQGLRISADDSARLEDFMRGALEARDAAA